MEEEINYIIEQIDKDVGFIIFKPYSKNFKRDFSEYPTYRIDINTVQYSENPKDYIAKICEPLINEIIEKEKNYNPIEFLKAFDGLENQIVSVPKKNIESTIQEINYESNVEFSNMNFIVS